MLRMIVDISPLLCVIRRKLKKFRKPKDGITMPEEQQVTALLLQRFICRDVKDIYKSVSYRVVYACKHLSEDIELSNELEYYSEVVGDMIMRYFKYIDDEVGYNCRLRIDTRRRVIIIRGDDQWLRRTIAKFELI